MAKSPVARSKLLSPLGHRAYALLWLGQTVSLLGDRIYATALPFLVLAVGGRAPDLGVTMAFFSVPQLAFLLVGGLAVDRFPRRLAILATDVLQALILAAAVALVVSDRLLLPYVYLLSAVFGASSAFSMPAARSMIPELVPARRLVAANALTSLSTDLGGVVGPAVGATLVASGGISLALGADASSFAVSGLCMVAMGLVLRAARRRSGPHGGRDAPGRRGPRAAGTGPLRGVAEGFRVVASSQWLWATVLVFSVVNVFYGGVIEVALPLLAKRDLGGPQAFGWILSATSVGSIAGALVLGRFERIPRRGLVAYASVAASGLALAAMSFAGSGWQAALVGGLGGCVLVVFDIVWEATLQEIVPGESLGRVVSVDMLGSFGLLPLGYLSAGFLVADIGPRAVVLLAGAGIVILALLGLSLRSVRDFD